MIRTASNAYFPQLMSVISLPDRDETANFTEAAQERNIEMGLLVRSRWLAGRVTRHFETLLAAGLLEQVL